MDWQPIDKPPLGRTHVDALLFYPDGAFPDEQYIAGMWCCDDAGWEVFDAEPDGSPSHWAELSPPR